ncbi:hypothetical protein EBB07_16085 [Paenibacillaceae bacterium]|nr:hypothetical protein EBB07_16085 [Paenibacillaceae bacterium]
MSRAGSKSVIRRIAGKRSTQGSRTVQRGTGKKHRNAKGAMYTAKRGQFRKKAGGQGRKTSNRSGVYKKARKGKSLHRLKLKHGKNYVSNEMQERQELGRNSETREHKEQDGSKDHKEQKENGGIRTQMGSSGDKEHKDSLENSENNAYSIESPAQPEGGESVKGLSEQQQLEQAREEGRYEGGELLLENALPDHILLPDFTLSEVVTAGVAALQPHALPLMTPEQVFARLNQSITSSSPCAVVRLGDGELFALSQGIVYDAAAIRREAPFLPTAGVVVPDIAARDQLAAAVRQADIVGVPHSRRKHYQPFMFPILRGHGIDIRTMELTLSTINYRLHESGLLPKLLQGRKVLIIGDKATVLAGLLTEYGITVKGVISPVHGFGDIDRVMNEARNFQFDIALVAAGIPAVVITVKIAAELGKVALDFGHLADQLANGRVQLYVE